MFIATKLTNMFLVGPKMATNLITRQACVDHFRAIKAINEAGPESEWYSFKGPNSTNSEGLPYATHATLDATTIEARKAEIEAWSTPGMVYGVNGTDHYNRLIRATQYACTCARNGELEGAYKVLNLVHQRDKEFFAVESKGPKDDCGMQLLFIVSCALYGEEFAFDLLGQNVEVFLHNNRWPLFGRNESGAPCVTGIDVIF